MYKLVATLSNGLIYVTNAPSVVELQRIAVALNASRYRVELYGDDVYAMAWSAALKGQTDVLKMKKQTCRRDTRKRIVIIVGLWGIISLYVNQIFDDGAERSGNLYRDMEVKNIESEQTNNNSYQALSMAQGHHTR